MEYIMEYIWNIGEKDAQPEAVKFSSGKFFWDDEKPIRNANLSPVSRLKDRRRVEANIP